MFLYTILYYIHPPVKLQRAAEGRGFPGLAQRKRKKSDAVLKKIFGLFFNFFSQYLLTVAH